MASPWLTPLKPIGRFGESLLDRVLCIVGAVGLSQAPEFFQQYLQRLGGHLDEARRMLAEFEKTARLGQMSLERFIEVTRSQPDANVARLGDLMENAQERVEALATAELALREASLWERPWIFLRHLDTDIASGTWAVFKPAVPVTAEGLVYAGVGMLLALGLYQLCVVTPCKAWTRRRSARLASAPTKPSSTPS